MQLDADLDNLFDEQLPKPLRVKADTHFTSVQVAQLAARMLARRPGTRVLDVGSGAGKFCIVAASEVPTCTFVGVEQRPHLVRIANRLAQGKSNVSFVNANAFTLDWFEFDALYFFNPFAEQLFDSAMTIDDSIEFAPENFARYVDESCDRLDRARFGTRVVTYHGMGGELPSSYERFSAHPVGSDQLELWVKVSG